MFSKSKLEFISYLAPVALAVIVLWVAWNGLSVDSRSYSKSDRTNYSLDLDAQFKRLTAEFIMDDCDLSIKPSSEYLFKSRHDGYGRPPQIEQNQSGGTCQLSVREAGTGNIRIDRHRRSDDLKAYITRTLPVNIVCQGDEADMRLDCRQLIMEKLEVNSEEGDVIIYLGDKSDSILVKLEGSRESDFRISVPENCGLKLNGPFENIEKRLRELELEEKGTYYMSPGYDTLLPHIDINFGADISRLSIDYY